MSKERYKLFAKGPPVGTGVTDSVHVGMAAIAKKASASFPFVVANELICNRLARVILLPCPPGALMDEGGDTYFVSLNFNMSGHSLPPASPAKLLAASPSLAWGIILFDIWVLNGDRHRGNLSFDTVTGRAQIFDHSHAFAAAGGDAAARFAAERESLGMGQHCLCDIDTHYGKADWVSRIQAVPDYFIEGIISDACSVGLPPALKGVAEDILKHRRDNLEAILTKGAGFFSKLPASVSGPIAAPVAAPPAPGVTP